MSDEEELRKFVRNLFGPEQLNAIGIEPDTSTAPTTAPVINNQANTPAPRTGHDTDRILSTTPNGWLGALFNNNPETYL